MCGLLETPRDRLEAPRARLQRVSSKPKLISISIFYLFLTLSGPHFVSKRGARELRDKRRPRGDDVESRDASYDVEYGGY